MSDYNRSGARAIPAGRADMAVDAGLRAFMLGVYNKLGLGLVLSAGLAWVTSHEPAVNLMFRLSPDGRVTGYTVLGMAVMWAPLAILLGAGFIMRSVTPRSSGIIYWSVVSLIGASLGLVMLVYTGASVVSTFFATAAAFGGLSLVGYTTKKDLTGFGSFLIVGLIGLVIASVVNIFLHSTAMQFMISAIGVLIFAGLIAYDTQRLKMTYYQLGGDEAAMGVATNMGALNLYLDFVNLFRFLLMFMGNRR